jgi:excisionase family DNA binding protein
MSIQVETKRLMTPSEVAELARVSVSTVKREIARGELRAMHVGQQLRIDPTDLRRYLERGSV